MCRVKSLERIAESLLALLIRSGPYVNEKTRFGLCTFSRPRLRLELMVGLRMSCGYDVLDRGQRCLGIALPRGAVGMAGRRLTTHHCFFPAFIRLDMILVSLDSSARDLRSFLIRSFLIRPSRLCSCTRLLLPRHLLPGGPVVSCIVTAFC